MRISLSAKHKFGALILQFTEVCNNIFTINYNNLELAFYRNQIIVMILEQIFHITKNYFTCNTIKTRNFMQNKYFIVMYSQS